MSYWRKFQSRLRHMGDHYKLYKKMGMTSKQIEITEKQVRRKDE